MDPMYLELLVVPVTQYSQVDPEYQQDQNHLPDPVLQTARQLRHLP